MSKIVREARRIDADPHCDGLGCHNPNLGMEDNLFFNALAINRMVEGVRATLPMTLPVS